MTRIPTFIEALEKMKEVHIKKNEDYADPNNPFSNFDVSEYLISIFKSNRDKTFVWPIATKLARLATLLNSDRVPNNESIEDTFIDIANYVLLWRSDYLNRKVLQVTSKCVDLNQTIFSPNVCAYCARSSETTLPVQIDDQNGTKYFCNLDHFDLYQNLIRNTNKLTNP